MYLQIVEILLGLLIAVTVLVTVAYKLAIPYPILLILGGLVLGFIPHVPSVELDPDLIFLIFLPPLLYRDASTTPLRDLRTNLRSILLLAVGLVLTTMVGVGVVAHFAIGLSWPVAFVLGAIVSPTDTVAASAIAQRLSLPRNVTAILEGEGLLNDATALVAYSAASGVVISGAFSPLQTGLQFVIASGGGIVIGLLIGLLVFWIRHYLHDPPVENTISLLTGFAAYLPAEALGLSGVLSVVAAGLFLERQVPRFVSAQTRLQGNQVWEVVTFLLNGLLFILVGLQLNIVLASHSLPSAGELVLDAALVCFAIILVRIAWVFPSAYFPPFLSRRVGERDPYPSWKSVAIVAWAGMRGGVSLAAALALVPNFPERDLIVFLVFCVILATLVVQGLTLSPLIGWLDLAEDGSLAQEEEKARVKIFQSALARLEELAHEDWVSQEIIEDLRTHYMQRKRRYKARLDDSDNIFAERIAVYQRLQRELLAAKRKTLIALRDSGIINDEVLRKIQDDIDMEEIRLPA